MLGDRGKQRGQVAEELVIAITVPDGWRSVEPSPAQSWSGLSFWSQEDDKAELTKASKKGSAASSTSWCCCLCGLACTALLCGVLALFLYSFCMPAVEGIPCKECAGAYYLRAACVLGGQPLPDFQGDARQKRAWEEKLFQKLKIGSSHRKRVDELLASEAFLVNASCPRWATWDKHRKKCTSKNVPDSCPVDPAINYTVIHECNFKSDPQCLVNYYRRVNANVLGGVCRCPNGERYQVTDNGDGCGSLACEGGKPKRCGTLKGLANQKTSPQGKHVTCHPNFVVQKAASTKRRAGASTSSSKLPDPDPERDPACWRGSEPLFMKEGFNLDCPDFRPRVRVPDIKQFSPTSMSFRTNGHPAAPAFGNFMIFYAMFNNTPAAEACSRSFGAVG